MNQVFFISDLHLGHKRILEFSPNRGGSNTIEHSEWLVKQWNSVVGKRDHVWVLGDIVFSRDHFKYLGEMKGTKNMIMGNHDRFAYDEYKKYFNRICGITKYRNFWLTHAPIHEEELRGLVNIHGHTHAKIIDDEKYCNVCVEMCSGIPISLDYIIEDYRND